MRFDGDSKENPLYWRFRIGTVFGITVRVHVLFIIGAVFVLAQAFGQAPEGYRAPSILQTLAQLGILFFIVLIHEFGHCYGARATGGQANEILLWPLGGLAYVEPPHTPRAHFLTTAAGPAVNVVFCALSASMLIVLAGPGAVPWNPLTALYHCWLLPDVLARWIAIFFAWNYILLLFNLLPIYPLDGGRMLHALLWPSKGYRQATLTATYVGMVGAIALGIAGLLTSTMMMTVIAVFGFVTCYYDRRVLRMGMLEESGEFGYDFSQGYKAFDEDAIEKPPGYWKRRKLARETARRQRQAEEARLLKEQVDRILAKVHREGMAALTASERRILQRETDRQRAAGG
jgi:Zn-dependent protease